MIERPRVAVYREKLLAASETFILRQAGACTRYDAQWVGLRRVPGLDLPAGRAHVLVGDGPGGRAGRFLFKQWGAWPPATRRLDAMDAAIVHAHFGADAAQLLPTLREVPLVVTFHGHDATRSDAHLRSGSYSDRLYLRRRDQLLERAALVVAVSDYVRDRLVGLGAPADKVRTHYIGVDTEQFSPGGQVEDGLILFVGRLVPQKGCADLVEAMASVHDSAPDARVVVIGDGPERASLERRARQLRVPVDFRGVRPASEVRDWMRRAEVVVVPSVPISSGWREALNLVAVEAQACGTPVVASRTGGLPEAVADKETGLLVPPAEPAAVARALMEVFGERGRQMGRAGRARVLRDFDLRRQTERLECFYDEVRGAS